MVFAWLGLPEDPAKNTHWLWENCFGFQIMINEGALFGLGQGWGWLFITLSIVAAVGIPIWLFYYRAAKDWLLTIALAGVMGGIFGNLFDRFGLHHEVWPSDKFNSAGERIHAAGERIYGVRDWILINYGGYDLPLLGNAWPNFNIADCLLVCGAMLLAWHAFRYRDSEQAKIKPKGTPTDS